MRWLAVGALWTQDDDGTWLYRPPGSSGPESGIKEDTEIRRRAEKRQRYLEETRQKLRGNVYRPLDAFAARPLGSCSAADLDEAVKAANVYRVYAPTETEFERTSESAGMLLDVADAAAARGCPDVARRLYRDVIATYTGWGFAAYRQRAEIGLADLRAGTR